MRDLSLGCIDNSSIPLREKAERAFNLGLAALLAENVYNFGEVLQHPVLDALKNTREQWLIDLLQAFNIGDVEKYEALRSVWQISTGFTYGRDNSEEKNHFIMSDGYDFCCRWNKSIEFQ